MKKPKNPMFTESYGRSSGFSRNQLALAVVLALAGSQVAQAAEEKLEEVTITGSRVRVTNGMETPNPVTVVTMDELSVTSPTTLIEGMAELPQFSGSATTTNTLGFFTSPGAGSLSLRGLQGKRTLTLLNTRRVVSSTIYGGPDINMFPEQMMKSVETVTGGASAAYGTDAVSGAVNFILDTKFKGYKGSVQYGENYNGDNGNYKVSLNGGWDLNEKSHLLLSFAKFHEDGIFSRDGYDWYKGNGLLTNPSPTAGQTPDNPLRLPYPKVISRNTSYDSVITFPAASNLGVWNVDQSGTATPFVVGSASDPNFHSVANGGSGTDNGTDQVTAFQPETGSKSLFGYWDYDVSDNLNVFAQMMHGEETINSRNNGGLFGPGRSFTINSGNPFIPANIQKLMTDNKVANITVGYVGTVNNISKGAYTTQDTIMNSFTTGFNYKIKSDGFLDGWAVDGYVQQGKNSVQARQRGGIRVDRIYLAVDAVTDAAGKTVCNVTKVSGGLYPDCVPYNPFGRNSASAAAADWVTGFDPNISVTTQGWLPNGQRIPYSYLGTQEKKRIIDLSQDVWELSANGDIYKGFGAGAVSMALGYAWRNEKFIQKVQASQGNPSADPGVFPVAANNAALGIRGVPGSQSANSVETQFSKVPFGMGAFRVREAFSELRVPLLAGLPFIKQLDADFAARWANYSGSGDVWSWKGGLEWQIVDQLRLRGTVSQDVRAATLGERYDRTGGAGTVIDLGEDPNGATTSNYGITTVAGGNPNVKPENAKTLTVGFVYQPSWLQGLQASVDWYNVDIRDNINQIGIQTIVDRCYKNSDVDACALIARDGPASTIKPGLNRISIVNDVYVNINSVEAQGIDFEVKYNTDIKVFGGGERLGLRLIGSKLQHNTNRNSVGLVTHNEGQFGLPDWNVQLSANYNRGPLNANLQLRYESASVQSNNNNVYQASLGRVRYDILNNDVASSEIVDSRVSYNFDLKGGHNLNVFLSVNNLLNQAPQEFITAPDAGLTQAVGNGVVGDLRGRRYVVGANFNF